MKQGKCCRGSKTTANLRTGIWHPLVWQTRNFDFFFVLWNQENEQLEF